MIIVKFTVKRILSILIFILLIFGLNFPDSLAKDSDSIIKTFGNQNRDHLEVILSYYETLVENNFSGIQLTNPTDVNVYNGIAGGVAGIGLELLRTLDNTQFGGISEEVYKNRILSLVKNLERKLIQFASVNNDTHIYWPVSDLIDDVIDLGYDFGLSGIFSFYSVLAKETNNSTYTNIATKILKTIIKLAPTAKWGTRLNSTLPGAIWWYTLNGVIPRFTFLRDVPVGDNTAIRELVNYEKEVTFLGKAFGSTGLGSATLDYYNAPGSNKTFAKEILSKVNSVLFNFTSNLTNWNLPIAEEFPNVVSHSLSTGLSGVGEYFLRQASLLNNETVKSVSKDIVNHFFIDKNYNVSFYSDSVAKQELYGLEVGVTGNLAFLIQAKNDGLLNSSQELEFVNFANFLSSLSFNLAPTQRVFPEHTFNNLHSFSHSYGTAGILKTLLDFDNIQNSTKHLNSIDLFREALFKNYLVVIKNVPTITDLGGSLDGGGVAVGAVGFIDLLLLPSPASFSGSEGVLDFGNVNVGESKELNFSFTNIGERDGTLVLSTIPEGFEAFVEQNIKVGSTVNLQVKFSPTQQKLYAETIIVSLNNMPAFTLTVTGTSFTGPRISLNSPNDGSTIGANQELSFTLESATGVKATKIIISNSSDAEFVNSTLTFGSGNIYTYMWDVTNFENGDYIVFVEAEDINSYTSTAMFQFSIAKEAQNTSNPFSGIALYLFIGLGILVIILVIVLVKQFR